MVNCGTSLLLHSFNSTIPVPLSSAGVITGCHLCLQHGLKNQCSKQPLPRDFHLCRENPPALPAYLVATGLVMDALSVLPCMVTAELDGFSLRLKQPPHPPTRTRTRTSTRTSTTTTTSHNPEARCCCCCCCCCCRCCCCCC